MKRGFVFTVSFLLLFSLYVSLAAFFAASASQTALDATGLESVEREAQALAALSSSVQFHLGFRDGYAVYAGNTTNVSIAARLPSALSDPAGQLNETAVFFEQNYSTGVGEAAGYASLNVSSVSPPLVRVFLENRSDALDFSWDSVNRSWFASNGDVTGVRLSGSFNATCQAPNDVCNATVVSGTWSNAASCAAGQIRAYLDLFDSGGQQVTVAGTSAPCVSTGGSGSALSVAFPSGSAFLFNVSLNNSLPLFNASRNASLALGLNFTAVVNASVGTRAFVRASTTVNNATRAWLFVRAQ